MLFRSIQYNTMQYNTIQYNTIQYNTIQYNAIHQNTTPHNTTIQYETLHKIGCAAWYITIHRYTILSNVQEEFRTMHRFWGSFLPEDVDTSRLSLQLDEDPVDPFAGDIKSETTMKPELSHINFPFESFGRIQDRKFVGTNWILIFVSVVVSQTPNPA